MSDRVKPPRKTPAEKPAPKRRYDSTRRQEQARQTQQHIADTARSLFIERGYNATSISDIADRAEVAVQTIYNAFGGKPAIMNRIADMAVVGDDEPVALRERDDAVALMAITDPHELLDRWAWFCVGIFERFLPILPVMREAAGTEATVGALWRTNAVENRYAGTRQIAEQLAALGGLRTGVTVAEAADLMWSFVSFDTAEALIGERGWTPEAYSTWIARLFRLALLPDNR